MTDGAPGDGSVVPTPAATDRSSRAALPARWPGRPAWPRRPPWRSTIGPAAGRRGLPAARACAAEPDRVRRRRQSDGQLGGPRRGTAVLAHHLDLHVEVVGSAGDLTLGGPASAGTIRSGSTAISATTSCAASVCGALGSLRPMSATSSPRRSGSSPSRCCADGPACDQNYASWPSSSTTCSRVGSTTGASCSAERHRWDWISTSRTTWCGWDPGAERRGRAPRG